MHIQYTYITTVFYVSTTTEESAYATFSSVDLKLFTIFQSKGGIFIIYEQALAEKESLDAKIQEIHTQLITLPKGTFFCSKNGKYHKWYYYDNEKQIYIPKSNRAFAQQLVFKTYLTHKLHDLLQEKEAIDSYLTIHKANKSHAAAFLESNPEYSNLLSDSFKKNTTEFLNWMNEPYEKNLQHPEHLIHQTSSGLFVRSKSESIIAMMLQKNQIPFRYECALKLEQSTFFPDFTIRHPLTGETYYWEHFGLMDELPYRQNAFSKLQIYASYGIIPSVQLITTYETAQKPINAALIEKIINHHFL